MGGPGVTALSCVQHISEAADILRSIKEDASQDTPPALKSKIVDLLEQLIEAKIAAVEAGEEIHTISEYAENLKQELEFVTQQLVKARPVASICELAGESRPQSEEDQRNAAVLNRMATFAAAHQGFRSLDTFASWVVAGTAAALALMVANFDKVEPLLLGMNLQASAIKLVVALGLIGVAKFFGSLITTMAQGAERVQEVAERWKGDFPSDEALAAATHAALPAPFRWLSKKFLRRSHDPIRQARQIMWFLMIAGLSTLTAVGFVVAVLIDIAMAF